MVIINNILHLSSTRPIEDCSLSRSSGPPISTAALNSMAMLSDMSANFDSNPTFSLSRHSSRSSSLMVENPFPKLLVSKGFLSFPSKESLCSCLIFSS